MNSSKFNVLLYFDDSQQSFHAAVYTATLLKNMPNMHLTVVQVQVGCENSEITENSWIDTKDLVNWAMARSNAKEYSNSPIPMMLVKRLPQYTSSTNIRCLDNHID